MVGDATQKKKRRKTNVFMSVRHRLIRASVTQIERCESAHPSFHSNGSRCLCRAVWVPPPTLSACFLFCFVVGWFVFRPRQLCSPACPDHAWLPYVHDGTFYARDSSIIFLYILQSVCFAGRCMFLLSYVVVGMAKSPGAVRGRLVWFVAKEHVFLYEG